MSTSIDQPGGAMIAAFEACYLYAYPDPGTNGEPWTIGIGATVHDGLGAVRRGDTITFDRAIARFRETLARKYVPGVLKAIGEQPQHRLNAATSMHYNTGAISSGSVDDKLRRGDEAAALATWAAYNKAGGRVMSGLVTRRAEEIRLWRTGQYPARGILVKDRPGAKGRVISPANFPWGVQPPVPHVDLRLDPIPTPDLPERAPSRNFIVDIFNAIMRLFQ